MFSWVEIWWLWKPQYIYLISFSHSSTYSVSPRALYESICIWLAAQRVIWRPVTLLYVTFSAISPMLLVHISYSLSLLLNNSVFISVLLLLHQFTFWKHNFIMHFTGPHAILIWHTSTRFVSDCITFALLCSSHMALWILLGEMKPSEKPPRSIVSHALWFDERFYLCSLMCIAP